MNNYQYLGKRTFIYWLLQRSIGAILIFVASIVFAILSNTILPQTIADMTIPWTIIVLGVFSLSLFMFAGAFISTRFMYANNRFALDEDALRIRRGIVNQEELALPYRQIQSINIERSYSHQMFGLSKLVILTAGQGFGKEGEGGESNEVFSTIDADVASWLQGELLKRINVQKVTEAYPQPLGPRPTSPGQEVQGYSQDQMPQQQAEYSQEVPPQASADENTPDQYSQQ